MAQLVRVLDERKWAIRCFYADLISILLVITLGIALMVDSHYVGYYTDEAAGSLERLLARDRAFFRMVIEGIGFALAFSWLVYRVVRNGYASITRKF